MPRLFKVSLEMIFDDEKSRAMSKEGLSDIIWQNVRTIGNGFQMLNVRSVSEIPSKFAQKQIVKICKEANRDGMRDPLLVIDLYNDHKQRYVCFPFNIWPFDLDGSDVTPLWLKSHITSVSGNAKQFRFFGVEKHTATVVTFYSSNRKSYNTVVLMNFKDFERLCNEVIYKEDK